MKYEEAIKTLNFIKNADNDKPRATRDAQCLTLMQKCLDRINISQNDLAKLNIIHVAGTKGKGSTCAFVESILRHHGYKTGFISSPHLIEVRERIRINGEPISKALFAGYFEDLYKRYSDTAGNYDFACPSYFYFLTCMAFHVFISQRVDVAIVEVGIGGMFDSTNVVNTTVVCGVTSLGYDHTDLLGNKIESIAWYKSGIFKRGATAFTSPQPFTALQVMAQKALDCNTNLQICPDLSTYKVKLGKEIKLGLAGDHQKDNASLALQIAQNWMRKTDQENEGKELYNNGSEMEAFPSPAASFVLTDTHLDALAFCQWRGRAQILRFNGITFYLDGAHTVKSMKCCSKWFKEEANQEERNLGSECKRILVFNVTKMRKPGDLFRELQDCGISDAIFSPNIVTLVETEVGDQNNTTSSIADQLLIAVDNHEQWVLMKQQQGREIRVEQAGGPAVRYDHENDTKTPVFATIADAIAWISEGRDETLFNSSAQLSSAKTYDIPLLKNASHVQVLVTGSVYLVGGFLRILDPCMNERGMAGGKGSGGVQSKVV